MNGKNENQKYNRNQSVQRKINDAKTTRCDALPNLVPFVQFKKREKHPWRSVTFSKVAG